MQTTTIETLHPAAIVRQREAERYVENQRFEERTDIGERLGYHVAATIHYEMKGGAAYCLTDTKHRPFHEQTGQAKEAGRWKFTGVNAFESERLGLEHDEALMVDAFGRGELSGNVLIKVSKVPDAVVNGTASVDGYRRDLLRSFVRIYYKERGGMVSCLLFSLDGNNKAGLQNIASLAHMDIAGRPSEVVLSDHTLLDWQSDDLEAQVQMLGEEIKLRYDEGVLAETGQKTYAGSSFTDRTTALQVIEKHNDLFEEHWRAISEVQGRVLSADDKEAFLEDMRRKTAAAIKLRENGATVGSISDGAVASEAASGDYGRECATNGMNQTDQAEGALEKDWKRKTNCPICGAQDVWAEKKGETIKGLDCGCELDVCTGRVRKGPGVRKPVTEKVPAQVDQSDSTESYRARQASDGAALAGRALLSEGYIKELFGSGAKLNFRKTVGDTIPEVVGGNGVVLVSDMRRLDTALLTR